MSFRIKYFNYDDGLRNVKDRIFGLWGWTWHVQCTERIDYSQKSKSNNCKKKKSQIYSKQILVTRLALGTTNCFCADPGKHHPIRNYFTYYNKCLINLQWQEQLEAWKTSSLHVISIAILTDHGSYNHRWHQSQILCHPPCHQGPMPQQHLARQLSLLHPASLPLVWCALFLQHSELVGHVLLPCNLFSQFQLSLSANSSGTKDAFWSLEWWSSFFQENKIGLVHMIGWKQNINKTNFLIMYWWTNRLNSFQMVWYII